jgi:Glycosyl hydrolase family 71
MSRGPRACATTLACLLAAAALSAACNSPQAHASSTSPISRTRAAALAPSPVVFAYYYQWFSRTSWQRAKIDLPLVGDYDSSDTSVMREQIVQAKSAGISGFIVSWKDTPLDDSRLELLMKVAAQEQFKLAMIYQGLDFNRNPQPVSRVADDFVAFLDKYASNPVFYRVDGKPLTIWSGTWAFSYSQVSQVTRAVRPHMLVLSTEKDLAGFERLAAVTDGDAYYWSSVNPGSDGGYQVKLDQMSQAIHAKGEYWIAPFAPGFDARLLGGQRNVPRNNGQTLTTEYDTAVKSGPNMLGLISWNEFSENTYVEPSHNYGSQALDVLRQLRSSATGLASGAPDPNASAPAAGPASARTDVSPWPNVLLLSGFALALVGAVAVVGYVRRRRVRRRWSTSNETLTRLHN